MTRLVLLPPRFFTLAILLATTGALTGCNLADNNLSNSTEPVNYQLGTIKGVIHGGFIPVVGSKVQIYATQNNGYGGAGLLLAEANSVDGHQGDGDDTDSNGNFTFSAGNYTHGCPAGQQVYITSSGGNTGAGANSNLLLMAALGSCASLYGSTASTASTTYGSGNPTVLMDEVTTTAAAYALANFITISGTTVNISAPVTNNFSDGAFAWNPTNSVYAACSGTACNGYASFNSSTGVETTYSNGLAHAFNNAVNLVNISTGLLYPYIVNGAGSTSGGSAGYGVVPRATINTVANAMQTCVNSVSSNSTLSSNCSSLFGATPNLSGTAPTNTLQAAINLAKNPYSNSTNVAEIVTLSPAQTAVYSPYLSSAPNDWSASIVYKFGGFNTPYNLALDANDNVYTNNTGGSSSVLVALSANGNFLYGTSGVTAVDSGGTALTLLRGLAADSNGYIYSANDINSEVASSDSGTFQFTASTGAYAGVLQHAYVASTDPIPDPDYVAVTRRNDVWTSYAVASGGNVDWWQCNGGNNTSTSCTYSAASVTGNHNSYSNGAFTETTTATDAFNLGIAVDGNQNVWVADQGYVTSGGTNYSGTVVSELTNGNAATQSSYPVYDNSTSQGTSPYNNQKLLPSITACGTAPYTFAFDSSNNGWFTVTTTPPSSSVTTPAGYLCEATVTTTNSIPTSIAISSPISVGAGIPEALAMDGNGVLWIPLFNYNTSSTGYANYGVAAYNTTSGALQSEPVNGYTSCYVSATASGAQTCTAGSTTTAVNSLLAISDPRQAAIDSAGNLWLNEPNGSTVTVTLGIAAPTVPLLSAGKFGVKP